MSRGPEGHAVGGDSRIGQIILVRRQQGGEIDQSGRRRSAAGQGMNRHRTILYRPGREVSTYESARGPRDETLTANREERMKSGVYGGHSYELT